MLNVFGRAVVVGQITLPHARRIVAKRVLDGYSIVWRAVARGLYCAQRGVAADVKTR